ncbi:MAG TPA: toprim domain-containing protein [Terriglobales bacterium]|nr:toprim domain-containing protein [Terriglobales bacterium]
MSADSIARALKARRSGAGWMAKCPAHDDNNPSLSIRDADGKVLLHCHAGCGQRQVIEALKVNGLWAERPAKPRRKIVATYDYTDEAGHLLYQVLRTEPKGFFQRRPDGEGGWINKKSKRQVLFHLREVVEAPIVFVVEGEKDAETLRSQGFVATTNAGGAEAPWLSEFSEALAGREVIVIPDNDKPGRNRAARIARALIGRVTRLVILELEGAKDVTEWFEKGHGELELIELVEKGLAATA